MNLRDQQLFKQVVAPPDRRRDLRYTIKVQIELREKGSDVPIRMTTTDLSRGGCYVELMMPFPVGTDITATLWLSNNSVGIRGRVVTRHAQFGNGIKFVGFDENGERILATYLDAINPFPE